MNEFQFSVSQNGRFLFRTDWDNDSRRTDLVMIDLTSRFPAKEGFRICRNERSNGYTSVELAN